jgi:hypothetical protein
VAHLQCNSPWLALSLPDACRTCPKLTAAWCAEAVKAMVTSTRSSSDTLLRRAGSLTPQWLWSVRSGCALVCGDTHKTRGSQLRQGRLAMRVKSAITRHPPADLVAHPPPPTRHCVHSDPAAMTAMMEKMLKDPNMQQVRVCVWGGGGLTKPGVTQPPGLSVVLSS